MAVAAGVLCLGLAACDPGEDPTDPVITTSSGETSTEPVTTESSSSTDVPTPPDLNAPTASPEMSQDTIDGAAAAVDYFFAALDYARVTGETAQLQTLSDDERVYCQTRIDSITELHDSGGWAETTGSLVHDAQVYYPTDDQPAYVVTFRLESPAITVHYGDGTSETSGPTDSPDFAASALWTGDGFVITGVDSGSGDG